MFSLLLAVIVFVVALPLNFGVNALEVSWGEVNGKTYILGDRLYYTDFEEYTLDEAPNDWEMSYSKSFGYSSTGATGYATIATLGSAKNVLSFGATGVDTWISMPEVNTRNYVYEATIMTKGTCTSGSCGIANGMYGGISKTAGALFVSVPVTGSPTTVKGYYRSKGLPSVQRTDFPLVEADKNQKGGTMKMKFVSLDGENHYYLNGRYVGTYSQGESDSENDCPGFYTYNGDFFVTEVSVTEIIKTEVNFNNVSVEVNDESVGLNIDLSFDKANKLYKNNIEGKYIYSETSPIKFGMVYAVSDSSAIINITADTDSSTDMLFTTNQETYEKLYFNHKIENIESQNLDKFYEIRPYVMIGSQYFYGEARSYSPARLANNIYGMSDDETKEKLSNALKESSVFKGENKNSLTFTLFSDFHYKENMYTVSIADLRSILKRADDTNSAFVMSGGDFCNDFAGSPELTNTYLNYIKEDGSLLTAYNIYGNHELETTGNSMENVTPTLTNDKSVIWGTADGSFDSNIGYYYFENSGFRIVCVDTNYSLNSSGEWVHNAPASYGAPSGNTKANSLGDVQLEWLEKVLTDAANKGISCIVMSHDGFSGKFATSSSDAATVREIYSKVNAIKAGTVIMSINGHHHTNHQGYNDGVFYFDMNTTRNGYWYNNSSNTKHYSADDTYLYEQYDDDGNLIDTYEKPINDLYQSKNTYFFAEPVSAVVTVDEFGTITIDGTETNWMYDVNPDTSASGVEPRVTSGTFWDGESLSHVWTDEWESNETHHWHSCANKSCTVTDISLNYGYETHTFEENGELKTCVCGAVKEISDEEITEETAKVWDGSIASSYSGGSGTASDPYLIENAEQLARMIGYDVLTNYTGNTANGSKDKYYKLTADIYLNDVSAEDWYLGSTLNFWYHSDVSRFCGNFDGDGHTVYGLCFEEGAKYVGLIPYLDSYGADRMVQNVKISHSYIKGQYAGGILGRGQGGNSKTIYFKNCYVDDTVIIEGTLTSSNNNYPFAGGFVGYSSTGEKTKYNFSNCASLAKNPDGTALKYGFVGMNATWYMELYYTIDNSFAYGTVWQGVTSKPALTNSYLLTDLATIKGDVAKDTMPNLDWENIWTVSLYPVYKTGFVCKNHIFSEWNIEFEATVYDKGVKSRICSVCGETETAETAKLSTEKCEIKLLGATRIILPETENIEYSLDGIKWQSNNVITGLDANTEYNLYVRRCNPVTGKLSGVSDSMEVKTLLIDNIPRKMNATELAEIRNLVLEGTNALWTDINGDSLIDARDVVRAKKVTAGLYNIYPQGDINEDGKVDDSDTRLLTDYISGKKENIPTYNADINGDGKLNQDDID